MAAGSARETYCGVHNPFQGLQEDQGVGGLAAGDPVIVVVLRQLVDLLQRQAAAHTPQIRRDVKALRQRTPVTCLGSQLCRWITKLSCHHMAMAVEQQ